MKAARSRNGFTAQNKSESAEENFPVSPSGDSGTLEPIPVKFFIAFRSLFEPIFHQTIEGHIDF
jgi:hypothetical protein